MRPVNLIPPDERRGASRPEFKGGGKGAYVVLGVLAVLVLGVFVLTSTNNQINECKTKTAELEQQNAQAKQVAQKFASYSDVQSSAEERFDAVYGVVKGRFDFERRLRQLTHVIPDDVSISELKATVAPDAGDDQSSGATGAGTGGSGSSSGSGGSGGSGSTDDSGRAQLPGPAFEMSACTSGSSWPSVAVMMTRMRNIDGVTKILVGKPTKSDSSGSAGASGTSGTSSSGSGSAGSGACKDTDITFNLVVGFSGPTGSASDATGAPTSTPTAVQQAGSARQRADQAAAAAGSDQSGAGSAPDGGSAP